jgi:peptidyl-prolyl cis-trans isomerase SurA
MRFLLVSLIIAAASAEIVDRVAVTAGNSVVTLSEVLIQARVAALIEGHPPKFDRATLRQSADRRVEQILLRREMILGDYAPAGTEAAQAVLASLKRDRFSGDESAYRAALAEYGVSEDDLLDQLQWQVTLLRFVEFRFRPGVQIPLEDITAYYEETFLPSWKGPGKPPALDDVSDQIELLLASEQVNNLVDRWLNSTRSQLDIVYREEAFGTVEESQ